MTKDLELTVVFHIGAPIQKKKKKVELFKQDCLYWWHFQAQPTFT